MVDSLQALGTGFLHLDLGDFVSTQDVVKEQRTRYLWSEMVRLGVDATTPGRRELSEWAVYEQLVAGGEIPVVSSNLALRRDGETVPLGAPYRVAVVAGVKVGLMGLIGANEFANAQVPPEVGLSFREPIEAAAALVPELRRSAEVVVLLSQMTPEDTEALLDSVPGIDVALYGNRSRVTERPELHGTTIVNQAGVRGQYAGLVELVVDPAGRIVEHGGNNFALDDKVRKDPLVLQRAEEADRESSRLRHEDLLAEQREEAAQRGATRYLGAETCKRCHLAEYDQWRTTPHARAFATLSSDHGMEKTEACTSCHVTGWGAAGGFVAASSQPDLRNVQCEACHGPGTEHVRTGGAARMQEAVCTSCHSGEFAKDWDFPRFYELVRHDR